MFKAGPLKLLEQDKGKLRVSPRNLGLVGCPLCGCCFGEPFPGSPLTMTLAAGLGSPFRTAHGPPSRRDTQARRR